MIKLKYIISFKEYNKEEEYEIHKNLIRETYYEFKMEKTKGIIEQIYEYIYYIRELNYCEIYGIDNIKIYIKENNKYIIQCNMLSESG